MARRLISLREFDELEGLVERHRGLVELLEQLERNAAAFDTPAQEVLELSRKATHLSPSSRRCRAGFRL